MDFYLVVRLTVIELNLSIEHLGFRVAIVHENRGIEEPVQQLTHCESEKQQGRDSITNSSSVLSSEMEDLIKLAQWQVARLVRVFEGDYS